MSDTELTKTDDICHKPPHSVPRLLLLGATWFATIVTMILNGLAQVDATSLKSGLFLNTTGGAYTYYLEIAPATWAFAIWGAIYIYQIIWLSYATSTVFRRCGDSYLFYKPNYLHPSLYIIYIINTAFNIIWIFLYDRQQPLAALFFLAFLAFTLYLLIIISIYGLHKHQPELEQHGHAHEYRFVIGMVHNAFGIYATWCTIATLLNFCNVVTLTYPVLTQDISSSISLAILTFEIMIYMLIDLAWFERYTRYLWSPYAVLIWALAASLQRNFSPSKPNSVFTLALILAVIFFAILKLILVIYREKRDPVFGSANTGRVTPLKEKNSGLLV